MSDKIFPPPYAPQIRQALEQGLRGIAKVCNFTAVKQFLAFPQAEFFKSFGPLTKTVAIKPPTPKTASFIASAPVMQVTNDVLETAAFVATKMTSIITPTPKTAGFTTLLNQYYLDTPNAVAISGVSQTNPVVITTGVAHGYSNGDQVYLSGLVGPTQLNNRSFTIANVTTFTFELVGENGISYPAWISGGTSQKLL